MSPNSPAIKAEDLVKRFENLRAVDGVSFEVFEGEVFGLLGPNGAGKTTTVRMLCALIPPTSGRAWVLGKDVCSNPIEVKKSIGLLPENPSVYESLTAEQNLRFFAEIYQVPPRERQPRIDSLLKTFGLDDRRFSKVKTFSKGMRQKLALARALLHDPPVVFLDEPTAGLDPESAKLVRDKIAQMSAEGRKTIFLCTHNLVEAESVCSRVAIIKSGNIVRMGSLRELQPGRSQVASYTIVLAEVCDHLLAAVRGLAFVTRAEAKGCQMEVEIMSPFENAPALARAVIEAGGRVLEFRKETKSLEEIYLEAVRG